MAVAQSVGQQFFPLDEELGLLAGRYTPSLQEAMTRLGSKLPFKQAAEEIKAFWSTEVSEATTRRTTHQNGRACEALARQAVEEIEARAPDAPVQAEQLVISTDGAFIGLTTGDWREVKTVAIGEFAGQWKGQENEVEVKASALSYFTRSYPIREFERYALAELHGRGLETAKEVVAVNDGSAWIQSFIDYHCPKAVRIIDFAHARDYVGLIGKTILGEGSDAFKSWYRTKSHQLKHEPPQRLLSELAWFGQKAESDEQKSAIEHGQRYLSQRREMIDYAHFRSRGYPIGSGSVESSHKHVVHSRLKQAGMRWAEHHVDPLLALRNLISNDRWADGWQQLVTYRQRQRWKSRNQSQPKPISPPVTLASVRVGPEPAHPPASAQQAPKEKHRRRPAANHPWRQPIVRNRSSHR
jgi:hypothetical protein